MEFGIIGVHFYFLIHFAERLLGPAEHCYRPYHLYFASANYQRKT